MFSNIFVPQILTKVNRLVELGLPVVKNYPCKIRIFTFSFFFSYLYNVVLSIDYRMFS